MLNRPPRQMTYDYIIIGAGAAGLQLADAMGDNPFFKEKSILLLDKDAKRSNDRTWCFWEKGKGGFDDLVHHHWDHIYFAGAHYANRVKIAPYSYKMVRGIHFYSVYLHKIRTYPNITFLQETVLEVKEMGKSVQVRTTTTVYEGKQVFNSILNPNPVCIQKKYPLLQQHFIGWFIKTKRPIFDADQATFMDFSIPQKENTRFMYVLPFSETEALVEYTLFSEHLLPEMEYEKGIETYMKEKYNCPDYVILEKEKGSIPMTCYDFASQNSQNIMHIGTAGGWTKASTGYTFRNISKKTAALIAHLAAGKNLNGFSKKNRFWFYDLILLDVLHQHNDMGQLVFESLFKKKRPQLILKFLDEETTLWEDFQIIAACPKRIFMKAFFRRLRYALR